MHKFLIICISFILSACAATGVKVDESKLANFKPGETTYADVIRDLGPPTTSTLSSNGQRMAMYSYGQAQFRPATFIPIVGAFAGGMDTQSSAVIFTFDQKGILQHFTSSQSQHGTGTGLSSGATPADQVSDQPRKE